MLHPASALVLPHSSSAAGDKQPSWNNRNRRERFLSLRAVIAVVVLSTLPVATAVAVVAPADESVDLEIPRPIWRLAPNLYPPTVEALRLDALEARGTIPKLRSLGEENRVTSEEESSPIQRRLERAQTAWQTLAAAQAPGARVTWNTNLGTPHRVRNTNLRLGTGSIRTAAAAEAAAREFIETNTELLTGGESPAIGDLELVKIHRVGEVWFLVFGQRYRGLEVLDGRIDLRLRTDGSLPVFGSQWFDRIQVDIFPVVHPSAAGAVARQAVDLEQSGGSSSGSDLAILPVPGNGQIQYRLVHRVKHQTTNPRGRWTSLVDAMDGRIWSRTNEIRYVDASGEINAQILAASPTDAFSIGKLPYTEVARPGDLTYSDASGAYLLPGAVAAEILTSRLRGPFMEAINLAAAPAQVSNQLPVFGLLDFDFTTTNSDSSERNAYFHALLTHDYIQNINPSFTAVDYRMPCTVNINSSCNAFWDGFGINFFQFGGGCANSGLVADVVYHEYGHGITQFTFAPFSPNGAMHEGFSDYLAASMTRQPIIGRGFRGPGSSIRTADNTTQVNDAGCAGQVHCVGTAVAGSLWDLQGNLIASLGDSSAAQAKADSLWHYAGFGGAPWFDDYLLDLLVVDDDDGTLLNGTPNYADICAAFEGHGIPCPDTTSGAWIVHSPLPDADPSASPFTVSADMGSFADALLASGQKLVYRLNGGIWHTVVLGNTGGDTFEGAIPALPAGGSVDYYLENSDVSNPVAVAPEGAPGLVHSFHVGTVSTVFEDDFETDTGWEPNVGNSALTGYWKLVDPNGTYDNSGFNYQTELDHTPDPGTMCYVTGDTLSTFPVGFEDIDGGCVFLISPRIDLSSVLNARLEYWRWFTNTGRYDDTLYVEVSGDDGANWVLLETQLWTENFWRRRDFDLGSRIALTDSVRIRIWACDTGGGSLTEAAIDDVLITTRLFDAVAVGDPPAARYGLSLAQNAPNPMQRGSTIGFTIPGSGSTVRTTLKLYDARGRLVRTLISKTLPSGRNSGRWEGRDEAGRRVSAGAYVYRLDAAGEKLTRKLILTP